MSSGAGELAGTRRRPGKKDEGGGEREGEETARLLIRRFTSKLIRVSWPCEKYQSSRFWRSISGLTDNIISVYFKYSEISLDCKISVQPWWVPTYNDVALASTSTASSTAVLDMVDSNCTRTNCTGTGYWRRGTCMDRDQIISVTSWHSRSQATDCGLTEDNLFNYAQTGYYLINN